jgi:hypothetical protein
VAQKNFGELETNMSRPLFFFFLVAASAGNCTWMAYYIWQHVLAQIICLQIPILFIFTGRRVCMLINGDYWMKNHAERQIEERRLVHVGWLEWTYLTSDPLSLFSRIIFPRFVG